MHFWIDEWFCQLILLFLQNTDVIIHYLQHTTNWKWLRSPLLLATTVILKCFANFHSYSQDWHTPYFLEVSLNSTKQELLLALGCLVSMAPDTQNRFQSLDNFQSDDSLWPWDGIRVAPSLLVLCEWAWFQALIVPLKEGNRLYSYHLSRIYSIPQTIQPTTSPC